MIRCPLVVLVEQGRLSQEEAGREMGLSTRQVRRVLKRYRESGQRFESLAYQRRHPAWSALPDSTNEEIRRLHREYPHWSAAWSPRGPGAWREQAAWAALHPLREHI